MRPTPASQRRPDRPQQLDRALALEDPLFAPYAEARRVSALSFEPRNSE